MKVFRAAAVLLAVFGLGWWGSRAVQPLTAVQAADAVCHEQGSRLAVMFLRVENYDEQEAAIEFFCESDLGE